MELNDTVVTSIKERRKPKFITSLAIVSEVMGVPMAAVESIARQNNIEIITKDRGACIDEDALCGVYADAYVRKIKCYFNNCTRHLYELNNAEQLQFYQFCNQYKKATLLGSVRKWEEIDEQSIRAHFEQEVKEKSPKQESQHYLCCAESLFGQLEKIREAIRCKLSGEEDVIFARPPYHRKYVAQSDPLYDISHSRWAYRQPKKRVYSPVRIHYQNWLVPARYYIYIGDDDDHIEEFVLTVNDHISGHSSNSIFKMVA